MSNIDQLSEAAQRLTPDEIRERLERIDQESRVLRALLRATLQGRRISQPATKQEATPC